MEQYFPVFNWRLKIFFEYRIHYYNFWIPHALLPKLLQFKVFIQATGSNLVISNPTVNIFSWNHVNSFYELWKLKWYGKIWDVFRVF